MKQVRSILGMTQQEFAVWLGIDASTVSRWERGLVLPALTVGQFVLLIDALSKHGYTLNDLDKMVKAAYNEPLQRQ